MRNRPILVAISNMGKDSGPLLRRLNAALCPRTYRTEYWYPGIRAYDLHVIMLSGDEDESYVGEYPPDGNWVYIHERDLPKDKESCTTYLRMRIRMALQ